MIADLYYINGEQVFDQLTRAERRTRNTALRIANELPVTLHHCIDCCLYCRDTDNSPSDRAARCALIKRYGVEGLRVCNNGPRHAHYAN